MRRGTFFVRFMQNFASHRIGPERGAAFQTEIVSLPVQIAKSREIIIGWNIDRLGNRLIDIRLNSRLHAQMLGRCQFVRRDESGWQIVTGTVFAP